MNNVNFQKLVERAGKMAMLNMWGEDSYKINMAILKADQNNSAAYTRLAKYYKFNDNIEEAKNMYLKALEIDPNNRGAINNLNDIERDRQESKIVEQIKTAGELFRTGQSSMLKGKYKMAAKLFSKAYDMEPLLKYAVGLAEAYKKMGKNDSIEPLYRRLIEAKHAKEDKEAIDNGFAGLLPHLKA